MSMSQMRARLATGLGRVQEAAAADPRLQVAGGFATGLALGKLVNRLGR